MEKKNLIYEALFDFSFRNIDNGLLEYVQKGERFQILKFDDYEQKVLVRNLKEGTELKISIYYFVSRFGEVRL